MNYAVQNQYNHHQKPRLIYKLQLVFIAFGQYLGKIPFEKGLLYAKYDRSNITSRLFIHMNYRGVTIVTPILLTFYHMLEIRLNCGLFLAALIAATLGYLHCSL